MTEAAPVRRRLGPRSKLALRIVVSVALLALARLEGVGVDDAIPDQHHGLTISLLVAAVLTALVGVVLSAWRWQRVLLLFDVRGRLPALFSHYLVGLLVGNVLPSTIGGDVVRVARAVEHGRLRRGLVRFGRARATHRLRRAAAARVRRASRIRPSLIDHAARVDRAARRGRRRSCCSRSSCSLAGHPRLAGPVRRAGELVAVHRRGAPRRRAAAPRAAPDRARSSAPRSSSRCRRSLMFGLIFRALDLAGPDRGGDRVRARGADAAGAARSRSAVSACAKARWYCSCTRSTSATRRRSRPACCGGDA